VSAASSLPAYPLSTEAVRDEGFCDSGDGTRLYWQTYTPAEPLAFVAVFPGGGDHSGRYPGLTSALVRAGFAVSLLDFRGHGRSDGRRWHVSRFREYLDDADAFVAKVAADADGGKLFVIGHSQGGLIAAAWGLAQERRVAGFVLSSPYLRLALTPPRAKILSARVAGRVVPWLPMPTGLRYADLTSDEEMQRWTEADALYGKATTPRWFTESQRAQAEVVAGAPDFRYPLLVLTGGADRIADAEASAAFVTAAGSEDKELLSYEGLGHEIFNERERERVFADVADWLSARCPPSGGLQGSMSSAARE
jgi:alpha-beta hydrolase superfamily lysophospholipase